MSSRAETRTAIIDLTREKGPMTAKQLSLELGIEGGVIRTSLRRARAHGTKYIRVAAWVGSIPKYGPGPDPDEPGGSREDLILEYLSGQGRATVAEIAKGVGRTVSAIDSAIRIMRRRKNKQIYVIGWKLRRGSPGGREAAIYARGRQPDAPKPDFTKTRRESEIRKLEKLRIINAMRGARPRSRRAKPSDGPVASAFDRLMRQ